MENKILEASSIFCVPKTHIVKLKLSPLLLETETSFVVLF